MQDTWWRHPAEIPHGLGRPDEPAVSDERRELTRGAFADEVGRIARFLAARGIRRGDVVATMTANRSEAATVMFAAWQLGAAVTPINTWLTAKEAGFQLEDSGAVLLVVDHENASKVEGFGIPTAAIDDVSFVQGPALALAAGALSLSDVALLIYTSGTTGRPKGVILDHANVAAMLQMNNALIDADSTMRTIVVLPLFHVNGLIVSVCGPLSVGGSVVIIERFSPKVFFEQVRRYRPTSLSLVPAVYLILMAAAADQKPDLTSLEYCFCGAAPIAPQALADFQATFGVRIIEGYGLSECTVSCAVNPPRGPAKPGSVGPAIPGCEIRVVDELDSPLLVGQSGEVVVRGPNVMRGYLGRPGDTAEALRGGWLHTGDVGYLDDDGYLFLVDRTKDMIIRGGENIYPKEIEDVLAADPAVFEAAVVGRAHATLGEVPVAFVQAHSGQHVDAAALLERCREGLAGFKVPEEIMVIDELPRIAVGKVSKPQLRARL